MRRLVVDGVIRYPDGREVCAETAAGRREYARRKMAAWVLQDELCALCGLWLAPEEVTADHVLPRGMGGGFRDDRKMQAAHGWCNGQRGSLRLGIETSAEN